MRRLFATACGVGGLLIAAAAASPQQPEIDAVTSAAFLASPAVGGLVTLFGANLSDAEYTASSLPLPLKLGSTSIQLCPSEGECVPAELIFVSPGQINFYAPTTLTLSTGTPGEPHAPEAYTTVSVSTASAKTSLAATFEASAVSLFSVGWDCNFDPRVVDTSACTITGGQRPLGSQRGAVIDQAGHVVDSSNPARIGHYYSAFVTGLAPSSVRPDVEFLNNQDGWELGATVSYAGPSSFVGLQQINFQIPATMFAEDDITLTCSEHRFDLQLYITDWSISGESSSDAHGFSLPVLIEPGDIPCQ